MLLFIAFTLAISLGLLLLKQRSRRSSVRCLHQALLQKQPFLREYLPGASGEEWDQLCTTSNELIKEVIHLQQQRTGQLAQLEATLGSLQEAVLIVDAGNYILLANKALQAIFPRATNILGQRLELVLHSAAFLSYVDAVRSNQGQALPRQELEFVESTQSLWLEVTGSAIPPLNGQKGPWTLFVLHDITKQKRLEAIRKDFVANVSHELRTPLSVIKGYTETLVDGHIEMPIEDRDRFLKIIQRHTERLNSLLEDLLVLSRLESVNPGLHRESIDLQILLEGIIDDYRARPAAAGHILQLQFDPTVIRVSGDPLKITQAIENLLDNALKYTPSGSSVELSAVRQGPDITLGVRDNGPGIPAADIPHIFERFYRVDKGRSREKGGTGLGLSIVKHIAQLHGGRAWVESRLGQGTSFFISLPTSTSSAPGKTSQ